MDTKIIQNNETLIKDTIKTRGVLSKQKGRTHNNTNGSSREKKKKYELQPIGDMNIDDRKIKLESPTSITMKNSYLIKNAN